MQTIQLKLKKIMAIKGVSINKLAKAANVPESSIKNILYGKSLNPRYELVLALSNALSCHPNELLSEDEISKYKIEHIFSLNKGVWDANLHMSITKTVMDICKKDEIVLTPKQANACIEEAYAYAKTHNENLADSKFINYLMKKIINPRKN